MSLLAGMKKVHAAKKAMDQKVAAGRANFFKLEPGETALVRFNCGPDEPEIVTSHFNNRNKGASPRHIEENCVGCWYKERGHKYLGYASERAAFNLIDCRFMHVEESKTEKTKRGDKPKRIYTACTEDLTCKGCRRKLPKERGGQKYWEMALSHAATLDTVNTQLSKKCKACGGQGRISVVSYECSNCAASIEFTPPEEGDEEARVTCGSCREEITPVELIQCSNGCDWPERGSITDVNIEVTRTGSDKQTQYNFVPQLPFTEPEDWMHECQPYDFKVVFRPQTPEQQAKLLGLDNPFASAFGGESGGEEGGAESYDDEGSAVGDSESEGHGDDGTPDDDIPF